MIKIVWLKKAAADLKAIGTYIASDNPVAASQVVATIKRAADILRDNPELGRTGRIEGTRELVISHYPYILPYYRKGSEIRILAVIHASRKWPDDPGSLQ